MSFPDAVLSRLVLIRVLPGLLILVYLSVIIASHSVPLDSGLGTTMGLAGMFTVIVVLFVTALRQFARKGLIARPPREWAGFVHLALFVVVGVACYFALTGNVSLACPLDRPPQDVASFLKSDNWKTSGGHYYVQSPYDSEGNDDPGAPWVEISRAEYVADIGSLVRQDASSAVSRWSSPGFWPASGGISVTRRSYRRSRNPRLRGYREGPRSAAQR